MDVLRDTDTVLISALVMRGPISDFDALKASILKDSPNTEIVYQKVSGSGLRIVPEAFRGVGTVG